MNGQFESSRKNYVRHDNLRKKYHVRFVSTGFRRILHSKKILLVAAGNIAAVVFLFLIHFEGIVGNMLTFFWRIAGAFTLVIVDMVVFLVAGAPPEYVQIMQRIERVPDFRNDDGEAPILIDRRICDDTYNVEEWVFQSFGIGFDEWKDKQQQLENALDVSILSLNYGADNTQIHIKLLRHPGPWPEVLKWDNKYLPENESQLCMGLNRSYPIILDFALNPHYMCAAETGAGKTVLLSSLIHQSIKKEYLIYLIDLKKFVDYYELLPYLDKKIDNKNEIGDVLESLVEEMNNRLELFAKTGVHNIAEYNQSASRRLKRILLVIDEYTEAIDKSSGKEDRAEAEKNEKNIGRLCKLSRAAGIHVVIGLQRGSAQEIDGQIRNNTRKIIGRCDDNLCLTMTGNTELGRMIPVDGVGFFVTDKRELFKSFYGGFVNKQMK